jgi:secreted trypsin-like serine protease
MAEHRMARRSSILLVMVLSLLLTMPAQAITYGEEDNGRHPNVGTLVDPSGDEPFAYCSGALIAPTVFLTAAHCDSGASQVWVTFDEAVGDAPTLYPGTFHADAQYRQQQNDPHDIAVVVFAQPILGIEPARLPTAGQFETLTKKDDQQFTAVGYGVTERQHEPGGGSPQSRDPQIRMYAVGSLRAVNKAWLRVSQNPATGDAGTCYGDSGGPNFLGAGKDETAIVAAITITGDAVCRATNVIYRLDTAAARDFLDDFVELP